MVAERHVIEERYEKGIWHKTKIDGDQFAGSISDYLQRQIDELCKSGLAFNIHCDKISGHCPYEGYAEITTWPEENKRIRTELRFVQ